VGRTVAKTLAAVATFGVAVFGLFVVLAVLAAGLGGTSPGGGALPTSFVAGDEGNRNKLLAIPVTGIILGEDEDDDSLFASLQDVTYGYDVKADLEEAAERDDIKGVVLEMDTPGGTIFGSKAIADAVAAYRERTGRPVLAYVRGLSASGGVYAMAGADRIVADHGTLVGSIGVIFGPISHYDQVVATEGGLLGGGVETTGGITQEYITAGRSKDLGNPYRALTEEERAVLQTGVDNNYAQFVDHVATGRSIQASTVQTDLGALIFDEQTALEKRLIDEVGNRDRAYAAAADLARLGAGDWQVVRRDRGGGGLFGLGALFGSGTRSPEPDDAASAPADVRRLLCGRGPAMMAYYGALPAAC
jgi:protease-4